MGPALTATMVAVPCPAGSGGHRSGAKQRSTPCGGLCGGHGRAQVEYGVPVAGSAWATMFWRPSWVAAGLLASFVGRRAGHGRIGAGYGDVGGSADLAAPLVNVLRRPWASAARADPAFGGRFEPCGVRLSLSLLTRWAQATGRDGRALVRRASPCHQEEGASLC
jgi:hypothetical protein